MIIQGSTIEGTVIESVIQGPYAIEYLVVAGGGGGAAISGGGGAGGLRSGSIVADIGNVYTVTVGAGGTAAPAGTPYVNGGTGSNSVFNVITSTGGGGGGAY